jgi:hypothetical protein
MYMGLHGWCGVASSHPLHQLPNELLEQSPSITNHLSKQVFINNGDSILCWVFAIN